MPTRVAAAVIRLAHNRPGYVGIAVHMVIGAWGVESGGKVTGWGNIITGKLTVKAGVHARVYLDGNIDVKARDIDNVSGLAANLQFYGISPTDPSATQRIVGSCLLLPDEAELPLCAKGTVWLVTLGKIARSAMTASGAAPCAVHRTSSI